MVQQLFWKWTLWNNSDRHRINSSHFRDNCCSFGLVWTLFLSRAIIYMSNLVLFKNAFGICKHLIFHICTSFYNLFLSFNRPGNFQRWQQYVTSRSANFDIGKHNWLSVVWWIDISFEDEQILRRKSDKSSYWMQSISSTKHWRIVEKAIKKAYSETRHSLWIGRI